MVLIMGLVSMSTYLVPAITVWLAAQITLTLHIVVVAGLLFIVLGVIVCWLILRKRISELKDQSARDSMLDIYNSAECKLRLTSELQRAKRYTSIFSACLIDFDGLKKANNDYGYATGDSLLAQFVAIVNNRIRDVDLFFRFKHGDEFMLILPSTDGFGARDLSEVIRARVEKYKFQGKNSSEPDNITVSIGVVQFDPEADREISREEFVTKLEAALKKAKKGGKNRTFLMEPDDWLDHIKATSPKAPGVAQNNPAAPV